jgi:hypothetical protein
MAATHWNQQFTRLIRQHNASSWGAMTLGRSVQLGDFGVFNSVGEFQRYGTVDTGASASAGDGGDWSKADSQVRVMEQDLKVNGEFIDPDSGTEVTAGLEWEWGFGKGTNLLIQMPLSESYGYDDVATTMLGVQPQLVAEAGQYGYLNRDGTLRKGFVVVVQVFQIIAGLVAGSSVEHSTFKINGAVNAINRLMGGEAGAAYTMASSADKENSFSFTWPQSPLTEGSPGVQNVASSDNPRTIAFIAACFDGSKLIPTYLG